MKEFPMQLLGELVAVLPDSVRQPRGQIVMPDWSRSLRGLVLATGDKCSSELSVGDHILFGACSGMESVFDGAAIRIMKEDDVLAVL